MPEEADIRLEDVHLLFRSYRSRLPSLKQSAINALTRRKNAKVSDFWIFQGIDLHVPHGQRLGIIGANGAGKSTMLKLIAGIYKPTRGRLRVVGRLAPLLELGAGMNPELSGLENILLNGALLGYGAVEMRRKAPEILEFAGLTEFAQTPLKYYSTGMSLRLGFSVATDIDPEVLVIDEIFAGGDAEFVIRAKDRMRRLMDASKIVVIVSHDLSLIQDLCDRTIWLDKGKIRDDGDPATVCERYAHFERDLAAGAPGR